MPARLTRSKSDVESIIDRFIEEGGMLLTDADGVGDRDTYEEWVHGLERWHARTRDGLKACYKGDEEAEEFYSAAIGGIWRQMGQSEGETFQYRQDATRAALNTLRSLRERLDFATRPPGFVERIALGAVPKPSAGAAPKAETETMGNTVFVVHGHDEAAKHEVARFLERVTGPDVVVLEEQADRGRTIIEKFEQHAAEAGYAVVLLTGDDEGRERGARRFKPRARQNVILELGFFIGRLGRPRVAMLYEEGVERPTDIDGVLYLPLDEAGTWKTKLAREMNAAGVAIDAKAVLGA